MAYWTSLHSTTGSVVYVSEIVYRHNTLHSTITYKPWWFLTRIIIIYTIDGCRLFCIFFYHHGGFEIDSKECFWSSGNAFVLAHLKSRFHRPPRHDHENHFFFVEEADILLIVKEIYINLMHINQSRRKHYVTHIDKTLYSHPSLGMLTTHSMC